MIFSPSLRSGEEDHEVVEGHAARVALDVRPLRLDAAPIHLPLLQGRSSDEDP